MQTPISIQLEVGGQWHPGDLVRGGPQFLRMETTMKTIIAGSRGIEDISVVEAAVEASGIEITEVVSGTAPVGMDGGTAANVRAGNRGSKASVVRTDPHANAPRSARRRGVLWVVAP